MRQRDEDKLQAALWQLIQLRKRPGVLCWIVSNNPRSVQDAARLKRMGFQPGIPDLHFLVNGRYQTLEIKTEKGRATPEQLAWMNNLNSHGAVADIGRGWDECVDVLQRRGVLLPGKYHRFKGSSDEMVQARSKRSLGRDDGVNG